MNVDPKRVAELDRQRVISVASLRNYESAKLEYNASKRKAVVPPVLPSTVSTVKAVEPSPITTKE